MRAALLGYHTVMGIYCTCLCACVCVWFHMDASTVPGHRDITTTVIEQLLIMAFRCNLILLHLKFIALATIYCLEEQNKAKWFLINQTNVCNRCYNTWISSQGHGIQGNMQFVTGNGFKWDVRWRSSWIFPSPDKGRNSSEWAVWPLWMLQGTFVVWPLLQFTHMLFF